MANDDATKPAGKKGDERERHLKLRQVEVFARAAFLGNLGAAAKELGVSPAYISEAITSLERDLGDGVVLFDRNPAGSKLTRTGEIFAEKAGRLLSAEEAAR